MSRHTSRWLLGITGLFLTCGSALSACHSLPATTIIAEAPDTIARIVLVPKEYAEKNVTINGIFAGWQGSCRGAVPATRSDWMIEDGGACLYVTGPVPTGFSSAPPGHGIGWKVSISGKIELTRDGRPYLRILR